MKMSKYKFFTDGTNKIVAVSTYAGRTVRGVAKCDPRDTFDTEKGEELAKARCAEKVAAKRLARAESELEKANRAVAAAQKRVEKMQSYVKDSTGAFINATSHRKNLEQEM